MADPVCSSRDSPPSVGRKYRLLYEGMSNTVRHICRMLASTALPDSFLSGKFACDLSYLSFLRYIVIWFSAAVGAVAFASLLSPPTIVRKHDQDIKRCQGRPWREGMCRWKRSPGQKSPKSNRLLLPGQEKITKNILRRPRRPSEFPDKRTEAAGFSRQQMSASGD